MFAERRREMDKQSLPSIEKFAAYLDGKLSPDEMQQFSQLAEHNDALRQLLDASARIREFELNNYLESELQLPEDITGLDFDLPDISIIDAHISDTSTLQPLHIEDFFSAIVSEDGIHNSSLEEIDTISINDNDSSPDPFSPDNSIGFTPDIPVNSENTE